MRTAAFCFITLAALAACSPDRANPTGPGSSAALPAAPMVNASSWGPETPPFNVEAILRNDNGGFGHVKLRQPNDAELKFHLDTWVRGLAPNTSYLLQRAVDPNVDDICTSTTWLTLGHGPVVVPIVTDNKGTGRADLWRIVTSPVGTEFDVHFQVIDAVTGAVALESDCYQFVITQ